MNTQRRILLFKLAAVVSTNPYQNTVIQQAATDNYALGMQPGPVHQNSIQSVSEQKFPQSQPTQPSTPVTAKPPTPKMNRPFAKQSPVSAVGSNSRSNLQNSLSQDKKNGGLHSRAQNTMNRNTPSGMKAPTTRSIN